MTSSTRSTTPSTTLLAIRVSGMVMGSIVSLLRRPFRSHRIGERLATGIDHLAAGRRADRLAVKRDGKAALGLGHARLLVEALAQRHARGAPDRFLRIERGSAPPLHRTIRACWFSPPIARMLGF